MASDPQVPADGGPAEPEMWASHMLHVPHLLKTLPCLSRNGASTWASFADICDPRGPVVVKQREHALIKSHSSRNFERSCSAVQAGGAAANTERTLQMLQHLVCSMLWGQVRLNCYCLHWKSHQSVHHTASNHVAVADTM